MRRELHRPLGRIIVIGCCNGALYNNLRITPMSPKNSATPLARVGTHSGVNGTVRAVEGGRLARGGSRGIVFRNGVSLALTLGSILSMGVYFPPPRRTREGGGNNQPGEIIAEKGEKNLRRLRRRVVYICIYVVWVYNIPPKITSGMHRSSQNACLLFCVHFWGLGNCWMMGKCT